MCFFLMKKPLRGRAIGYIYSGSAVGMREGAVIATRTTEKPNAAASAAAQKTPIRFMAESMADCGGAVTSPRKKFNPRL